MNRVRSFLIGLCMTVLPIVSFAAPTQSPARQPPPVKALVANFYYNNLAAAQKWYV